MKKVITFLFTLLLSTNLWAQGNAEKVKHLKMEYLAEQMQLNTNQSKKFWPLYDQYEAEMRNLRRSIRKKYEQAGGDMKDRIAVVNHIYNSKEFTSKRQTIRDRYKGSIQAIITTEQYKKLLTAEQEFRNRLINQLRSGNLDK